MRENIINLDLHGGDFAPNSVLEGARIAKLKYPHIKFNFIPLQNAMINLKNNIQIYLLHQNGLRQKLIFHLK